MEKASGGGKPAARFGFDFSWADEVEREEREQQLQSLMEQQGREAKEEEQTRADPFGAARPREVVLAEKGIDWRARDRELDAAATREDMHVAVSAARDPAASSRARIVPASSCASTLARRGRWDRGSGPMSGPRRHDAGSTPQAKGALPVSGNAWGGGKRKCTREVPAPATARRVQKVGDQGRTVFGELNVGEGCGSSASSLRSAGKKTCDSGGSETKGSKASAAAAATGGGSRDCSSAAATASSATATEDKSAVSKKRKKGRGRRSKKTENQQTLLF
jgi:hypothetical protein